jgi:sugar phosphate isomerase/epimerase
MTDTHTFTFSVFTKPWKMLIPDLARHIRSLGFTAIELPVRSGYPVTPENVGRELTEAVRMFADAGLSVTSIAGPTDEATVAACAETGIRLIRIMVPIGDAGYLAEESETLRMLESLVPRLDQAGVKVGIQNHYGRYVCHALGLRRLCEPFDPRQIGAIWDAAHTALSGEEPEIAIEIIWDHLAMVNLKNAFWQAASGPETSPTQWHPYWTDGRHGLASWPRVAAELKRRNYAGVVCLTAEYTDEPAADRLVARDLLYAQSLWERGGTHGQD